MKYVCCVMMNLVFGTLNHYKGECRVPKHVSKPNPAPVSAAAMYILLEVCQDGRGTWHGLEGV
jgi:hypothetical protein